MAEGDTILRTARRLEPLVGEEVAVRAPKPRGRAAGVERLDGTTVERIESHGKNLLIVFGELALHSHMGMNGSWHLYRRGARWSKPARSAWAVLEASEVEAVQFGGPTLRLLPAASLRRDATLARLGPDVLAPEFDPDDAVGRLRTAPEREIGDALLDQGKVAGIGNIFKSEALFAARVDPWARIDDLADEDLRRVLLAAREAMLAAVEEGRHRHAVYKLAGRPCPRCGAPLRSRGQGDANRTTYWCGICQGG